MTAILAILCLVMDVDIQIAPSYFLFLDYDECATSNGGCEHTCINTYLSFYCVCRQGYMLSADKRNCEGECYFGSMPICATSDHLNDTVACLLIFLRREFPKIILPFESQKPAPNNNFKYLGL